MEPGVISNLYNYQLVNKTDNAYNLTFYIENIEGESIQYVGKDPSVLEHTNAEGALFIKIPEELLKGRKTNIKLVAKHNDEVLDYFKTTFLGPIK